MVDRERDLGRSALDAASEILRLRERAHNHENRIAALELRSEYQTALMHSVESKLDRFSEQLSTIAKRDELEAAISQAKHDAIALRDRAWIRGLTLPQRALVWSAGTVAAALVIANAIRGLFG